MIPKVNAIKLERCEEYFDTQGEKLSYIQPISTINILVGANNSGKSRLMRRIAAQPEYKVLLEDTKERNETIHSIVLELQQVFSRVRLRQYGNVSEAQFARILNELMVKEFSLHEDTYLELREIIDSWVNVELNSPTVPANSFNRTQREGYLAAISRAKTSLDPILDSVPKFSSKTWPYRIYIPTLRGLRPLDANHTDFYSASTRSAYFHDVKTKEENQNSPPKEALEIFSGLGFYHKLTELLLGNNRERRLIVEYQRFISDSLFEGKNVTLIPNKRTQVVVVKIGAEAEQPIHHLGDGIQSALILSFLPFVTEEPGFFFIEEPEMLMHPGLQRKLLEFFASLERHTFFLTTHSNHFLELTADIKNTSIFSLRKSIEEEGDEVSPTFTVEPLNSGNQSSLELLGVRNSSVFLVNATIWVEGITDRLYLRRILALYVDHLRSTNNLIFEPEEDVHFSFVEYGGANIVHWSFLDLDSPQINVERLCAKAMVVIDGDGAAKLARKKALKDKLGDRFVQLPTREIENLLPFDVIRDVVLKFEKSTEKLPDFSARDYKEVYLGEFIETQLLQGKSKRKGGYKEDSGTLKSKLQFCHKAIPLIKYSALPSYSKLVAKKIYDFIATQN
jgi:predicted ATP-dependent endonuclease of OLD family